MAQQPSRPTTEYPIHEAAELFPLLKGQAFDDLVENIRRYGLRDPIVLTSDRKILDGRNRYRACLAAGVEPKFETFRGPGTYLQYVISKNLHRRHLDTSQRAMIAAKIATLESGARTDLASNEARSSGLSQPEAAEALNVSRASVQRAKEVIDKGTPELVTAVRDGVLSVGAASEAATLEPEAQKEIVRKVKTGAKPATAVAQKKRGLVETSTAHKAGKTPEVNPDDRMSSLNNELRRAGCRSAAEAPMPALRYLLKRFYEEGRKNMATMSPGTILHLAHFLELIIEALEADAERSAKMKKVFSEIKIDLTRQPGKKGA